MAAMRPLPDRTSCFSSRICVGPSSRQNVHPVVVMLLLGLACFVPCQLHSNELHLKVSVTVSPFRNGPAPAPRFLTRRRYLALPPTNNMAFAQDTVTVSSSDTTTLSDTMSPSDTVEANTTTTVTTTTTMPILVGNASNSTYNHTHSNVNCTRYITVLTNGTNETVCGDDSNSTLTTAVVVMPPVTSMTSTMTTTRLPRPCVVRPTSTTTHTVTTTATSTNTTTFTQTATNTSTFTTMMTWTNTSTATLIDNANETTSSVTTMPTLEFDGNETNVDNNATLFNSTTTAAVNDSTTTTTSTSGASIPLTTITSLTMAPSTTEALPYFFIDPNTNETVYYCNTTATSTETTFVISTTLSVAPKSPVTSQGSTVVTKLTSTTTSVATSTQPPFTRTPRANLSMFLTGAVLRAVPVMTLGTLLVHPLEFDVTGFVLALNAAVVANNSKLTPERFPEDVPLIYSTTVCTAFQSGPYAVSPMPPEFCQTAPNCDMDITGSTGSLCRNPLVWRVSSPAACATGMTACLCPKLTFSILAAAAQQLNVSKRREETPLTRRMLKADVAYPPSVFVQVQTIVRVDEIRLFTPASEAQLLATFAAITKVLNATVRKDAFIKQFQLDPRFVYFSGVYPPLPPETPAPPTPPEIWSPLWYLVLLIIPVLLLAYLAVRLIQYVLWRNYVAEFSLVPDAKLEEGAAEVKKGLGTAEWADVATAPIPGATPPPPGAATTQMSGFGTPAATRVGEETGSQLSGSLGASGAPRPGELNPLHRFRYGDTDGPIGAMGTPARGLTGDATDAGRLPNHRGAESSQVSSAGGDKANAGDRRLAKAAAVHVVVVDDEERREQDARRKAVLQQVFDDAPRPQPAEVL